ncbi:LOW QUALITY PROTEIN: BTB/POZ domain-containing protein KCTD9-like [Babylonia areolata]|uniref:LOW QUALITY PROTEIN: BTB/POZ domain-containing protein KCTD9-like n=1 Tax=Babylonia areolata TaxID=304850 RepID=UPI003FD540F6
MKRVTVFRNGRTEGGRIIGVKDTFSLSDVLSEASKKLICEATELYTSTGGLVDEVDLIKDDEVLYASCGEPFLKPQLKPVARPVVAKSYAEEPADQQMHVSHQQVCTQSEWVHLNVGGKLFTTTVSTLTRTDGHSMLARMFTHGDVEWQSAVDEQGAYLIDRSPLYFEPILNYLRHGQLVLDKSVNPEGVLEEAKFFGMTSLIEQLEDVIEREQPPDDSTPITRRELVMALMVTPTNKELRCQGVNFSGANLSKLDLRYINFKYAILRKANLSGANLSYCNFERADLCSATLDSANLLGVKVLCANMEGASMRGCNFEDPAGSRANMEGALMKNVDLEGSHMAGVNLRVATLKNANLQNCDLRGAVLAGADLENCDLSGCDLQEANLRGANLKGATFELMLNPLHMAQAVR